jgi:hypothetical protein
VIDLVLFWETQDAIDNNRPIIVEADRVVKVEGIWYAHGSCHTIRGVRYATTYGDPAGVGQDNTGIELAEEPAVGKCTFPVPSHGSISEHSADTYALSSGAWEPLLGGELGSDAVDVAWNGGNGTITVDRSGNWDIHFSIAAEWAVGIFAPRVEAAIWDVTNTPVITPLQSSMRFFGLGDGSTCSAGLPMSLADGTLLQLQVQANQTGTLDVRHFSIGLKRRQ